MSRREAWRDEHEMSLGVRRRALVSRAAAEPGGMEMGRDVVQLMAQVIRSLLPLPPAILLPKRDATSDLLTIVSRNAKKNIQAQGEYLARDRNVSYSCAWLENRKVSHHVGGTETVYPAGLPTTGTIE